MKISYWENERTRFEALIFESVPLSDMLEAIENMQNKWTSLYGSDTSTEVGKEVNKGLAVTVTLNEKSEGGLIVGFPAWTSGTGFDPKEKYLEDGQDNDELA